jgi:dTDP-4-amino-4,6-dideoxygalactose transaminase
MHENMYIDYNYDALVCISFQQKKRLSLGRGGAILFNNKKYLQYLKRLCYDGRNSSIPYTTELKNNLNDIICGYHCYLEPDKAVQGILKLNQIELLPKYKPVSWKKYPDISTLKFL